MKESLHANQLAGVLELRDRNFAAGLRLTPVNQSHLLKKGLELFIFTSFATTSLPSGGK
jgi:hypothetical protein